MLSASNNKFGPEALGSKSFRERYGIRYAYLSGAMYKGIASKELVVAMGNGGLLGFLGTGGRDIETLKNDIIFIKRSLDAGKVFGVNLLCQLERPDSEFNLVEMYMQNGVTILEASAYMQMTLALVYYRVSGMYRSASGDIKCKNKIIAKLSRPEVAKNFLSPAPQNLVRKLLENNKITKEQSEFSQLVPMCSDICVEADSGGHTDRGVSTVILPSIQFLKISMLEKHQYKDPIHIGLAGGIGVPQSAASAFMMGADFILTGSINQCTVEAATSDYVKDILQTINVQDTDYAPAGDMFELGAKVQVLKKGSLFAVRATKLYDLYQRYSSWEEIPEDQKRQIENKFFKQTFEQVWIEVQLYQTQNGNIATIKKAQKNSKQKLALVFKKYFNLSTQYALQGSVDNKIDFQVHTGPALGAFNQWVKETPLAIWRNRYVVKIAENLMKETAVFLNEQYNRLSSVSINKKDENL
jgi:trans-AT polyketide synthase/acyltransferase/oxidoreductase domain-containing protein